MATSVTTEDLYKGGAFQKGYDFNSDGTTPVDDDSKSGAVRTAIVEGLGGGIDTLGNDIDDTATDDNAIARVKENLRSDLGGSPTEQQLLEHPYHSGLKVNSIAVTRIDRDIAQVDVQYAPKRSPFYEITASFSSGRYYRRLHSELLQDLGGGFIYFKRQVASYVIRRREKYIQTNSPPLNATITPSVNGQAVIMDNLFDESNTRLVFEQYTLRFNSTNVVSSKIGNSTHWDLEHTFIWKPNKWVKLIVPTTSSGGFPFLGGHYEGDANELSDEPLPAGTEQLVLYKTENFPARFSFIQNA